MLAVLLATLVLAGYLNQPRAEQPSYAQVRALFEQEQVESFTLVDTRLTLRLRGEGNTDKTLVKDIPDAALFYEDLKPLIEEQYAAGILKDYDYRGGRTQSYLVVLPYVAAVLGVLVIWYLLSARAGGGNGGGTELSRFGSAAVERGRDATRAATFDDVAGADEEKEELQELVDFLREPERFTELGARIPKGVLLVGPPGTGKTLLARAVAGEAGVEFLSISGSDFVEMYVGVGAKRVRDLFEQAKKCGHAIVFIDEIDAVGRQRGTGLGGGHDEREQTLNQLLVEMDGFGTNEGVVVMAATNRADILDPALLRPGRFDRQVYVGLPDVKGREDILRLHTRRKPLAEDVDLKQVARATAGFTGADLENLANEAALLTARRGEKLINAAAFDEAEIKVIAGPEKRSRVVTPQERRLTAYHEAGHAVVMRALPTHDPVHRITIIPRGQAGGMTISLPEEDRSFRSKREMEEEIVSLLGGRVAEAMMLGDVSTGASNDIQRASRIARRMVTVYGMSETLGTVSFESGHDEVFIGREMARSKGYSEAVAAQIDAEVKRIVDEAYRRCEQILARDRDKLTAVAEFLLRSETMSAEEFEAVFVQSDKNICPPAEDKDLPKTQN
ncbi:MAG: ATP-dependent zinc metalloprotease FtsH [Oscillospiraceae bacterium]|nr:ATP-dependent zinc metalloprotease FtsH [Oscillospiraceae bacterium]